MMWLRNPLLTVVCLLLLANLLFNGPASEAPVHARGASLNNRAGTAGSGEGRREHDAEFGQLLYSSNCTACHGTRGHGMPRQGANLRTSKFIAEHTDEQLVAFLRQGRTPADPTSIMGMLMPPRGGNRTLDDPALADIVAFLREVQSEARQEAAASSSSPSAAADTGPVVPQGAH
jgi:mono/diheme cytochrome c family protein